ncbi:hypothetical protein NDA01_26245 [Trichocoleus desertorum AS-A10]|uniref:hypothetical protein n=1 Tax=Trichocoleus desertorum TaxID=1481672 RepID=UPI003298E04E
MKWRQTTFILADHFFPTTTAPDSVRTTIAPCTSPQRSPYPTLNPKPEIFSISAWPEFCIVGAIAHNLTN